MDDQLLVSRTLAGDLDSFGQVYDRYFNRVYDFAWRVLHDVEAAGQVTREIFATAARELPRYPKGASFRAWIFAIAHNAVLARAERDGAVSPLPLPEYEEAFGSFDVPDPVRLDDESLVAGDHELALLVWEAVGSLNARDYALLDLHLRQQLEAPEIATVLGVSKGNAQTMLNRMKSVSSDVIATYIVARRGSVACDELQQILAATSFPEYTDAVRREADAHIKTCATCTQLRSTLPPPLPIFASFAAAPAPFSLKGDAWRVIVDTLAARVPAAIVVDGEPAAELPRSPYGRVPATAAGGAGFYGAATMGTGEAVWDRNKVMLFAGAAAGLLLFAFVGGAILAGGFGGNGDGSALDDRDRTATAARDSTRPAGVDVTPGVAPVDTATPDLTPSVTPTEEPSATPAPPEDTPTLPPALPTDTPEPIATPTPEPVDPGPDATPTRPSSFLPGLTPIPGQ